MPTIKFSNALDALGHILGVCPCCANVFYLSEVRPYLRGKKPKSSIDALRAQERRLDRIEEELLEVESALREKAAVAGLRATKKLLKRIDPVFSGTGYDPQDVKVIFNPVTYVVFNGLATGDVSEIALLADRPQDGAAERTHNAIQQVIDRGNFEFRTIRVDGDGGVTHR